MNGRQAVTPGGRPVGYLCLKVKSLMPSALSSTHGSVVLACPGALPSSAKSTSTVSMGNILPSTLNPCGWGTSPHSWPWRGAHSPGLASDWCRCLPVRDTQGFLSQSLGNRYSRSAGVAKLVGFIQHGQGIPLPTWEKRLTKNKATIE